MKEGQVVKVACSIPNGITLQLHGRGYDDGTGSGARMGGVDGPRVKLAGPSSLHMGAGATFREDIAPGLTEVDAAWWERWKEQNKLNPFFAEGLIREVEDEARPTPAA